jgi:hypothetical protein
VLRKTVAAAYVIRRRQSSFASLHITQEKFPTVGRAPVDVLHRLVCLA